jgi:hypothetical protein
VDFRRIVLGMTGIQAEDQLRSRGRRVPALRDRGQNRAVNQTADELICSFCQKRQSQVKKMIAGPGVYICDDCVQLCCDIIEGELGGPAPQEPPR